MGGSFTQYVYISLIKCINIKYMRRLKTLLFFLFYFVSWSVMAESTLKDSILLEITKTSNIYQKIDLFLALATNYSNEDMTQSLTYTNEALALVNTLPESEYTERYYSVIAVLFLSVNVYDKAYEYFLKSLHISEEFGHRQEICITNSNIGGVYLKLLNYEEALICFSTGLKTAEELLKEGNSYFEENICAFYNNVGLTQGKLGKCSIAISYLEKAIELVPKNNQVLLAQYYGNVAPLYYEIGEKKKGADCLQKSRTIHQALGNVSWVAYDDFLLASFHLQDGNYMESKATLDSAYQIAFRIQSKALLRDIYGLYIRIYRATSDYKAVSEYQEKLYDIKAKLVNEEVLGKVTTLKLQYDFTKKEAQIKLEQQRATFRHRLILTVACLLIVILSLLYLLIRARMKQVRGEKVNLERDLELRNKELTTNAMFLMKNTELVREVVLRLIQLKPNLKQENIQPVKDAINDLQTLTREDLWDEFEARFNRVHNEFYTKLHGVCPDLTPAELKLCAFLRLNMSTKEIASLIGITDRSVDVMRGRIRKKMNINNTNTNLITYLSEF